MRYCGAGESRGSVRSSLLASPACAAVRGQVNPSLIRIGRGTAHEPEYEKRRAVISSKSSPQRAPEQADRAAMTVHKAGLDEENARPCKGTLDKATDKVSKAGCAADLRGGELFLKGLCPEGPRLNRLKKCPGKNRKVSQAGTFLSGVDQRHHAPRPSSNQVRPPPSAHSPRKSWIGSCTISGSAAECPRLGHF